MIISTSTIAIESIYIGSFTPKEEVEAKFIIELKNIDIKEETIILEFKNNNFLDENNYIPLARLYMNLKSQKININNRVIKIEKNKLLEDAIGYFIPATFKFTPVDKPGVYKNILYIKNLNNEIIIEKEIIFEINRWARYEFSENEYIQIINNDLKNNKITSQGGMVLKIASNSNWQLFGKLNEEGTALMNKLKIYIRQKQNENLNLGQPVILNNIDKLIHRGGPTLNNNNYWTELDLYLEIEDIQNIKSGAKKFPIIFILNTVK